MDYRVDLDSFRGPLDLLLFLVRRQEVDICDIPIARVADQFLDSLRGGQLVDVDRAGEFLVMAATLMEIKSRTLLPREEVSAEETDPRMELVKQLVEYKRYKDAAAALELCEESQACRVPRQPVDVPDAPDPARQPLRSVELWDLLSAFGRILRETLALQPQQVLVDETPMHVYQEQVLAQLASGVRLGLRDLFTPPHTRPRLVGLFLALLELIRGCQIRAEQGDDFGEIWLVPAPPALESAAGTLSPRAEPAGTGREEVARG